MIKRIALLALFLLALVALYAYSQTTSYSLGNGPTVSVWESPMGKRYLLLRRFISPLAPDTDFIELERLGPKQFKSITFYFVDGVRDTVFYQSEIRFVQSRFTTLRLLDLHSDSAYYRRVYPAGARRHNDLFPNVQSIDLFFEGTQSFAIDKTGVTL